MSVQAMTESLDLADALVTTAPSAGRVSVKRAFVALATWVNKVLFAPSPKAAARHGLDMWASMEHVDHYEVYRLSQNRGVPR